MKNPVPHSDFVKIVDFQKHSPPAGSPMDFFDWKVIESVLLVNLDEWGGGVG